MNNRDDNLIEETAVLIVSRFSSTHFGESSAIWLICYMRKLLSLLSSWSCYLRSTERRFLVVTSNGYTSFTYDLGENGQYKGVCPPQTIPLKSEYLDQDTLWTLQVGSTGIKLRTCFCAQSTKNYSWLRGENITRRLALTRGQQANRMLLCLENRSTQTDSSHDSADLMLRSNRTGCEAFSAYRLW